MHRALVLCLAAACTKASTEAPAPPPRPAVTAVRPLDAAPDVAAVDPNMRAMPATIPSGPYVIRYDCFHSDEPFGRGHQVRNLSYDLAKATWTSLDIQDPGDDKPGQPLHPGEKPTSKVMTTTKTGAISPASVARIRTALDAFLHGGPYRQEHPVPEGTPCALAVGAGGTEFFTMAKAATEEPDLATALLAALRGS